MSTDDTKRMPDLGSMKLGGASEEEGYEGGTIDSDFDDVDSDDDSSASLDELGDSSAMRKKSSAGKLVLPALALTVATVVGTMIIFGPQMLGKPSNQPLSMQSAEPHAPAPVAEAPLLPEPSPTPMPMETAAAPAPPQTDVPPQPPAPINESTAPSEESKTAEASVTVEGALPQPDQSLAVENALTPVVEPTPMPEPSTNNAEVVSGDKIAMNDQPASPAPDEVSPSESEKDSKQAADAPMFATAPEAKAEEKTPEPEAAKPSVEASSSPVPPATVSAPPVEDLPPVATASAAMPDSTTPPLIPDFEVKGAANAPVKPDANEAKIPDVYYDGINVPSGAMAKAVGPRKMDPTQEPASKFVIVEKTHNANDRESQVVAASRALKLGRYEAAADMYQRLYDKNPRDPRILMGLAVAQQNAGMADAAIKTYQEFLDIKPDDTDATVNMLGLIREQYPEVALRRLKELSAKYPTNAGIAAQIGITVGQQGKYDEALQYLGVASSMQPQNALHLFNMAIIAEKKGDKAKAVNYYERALEVDAVYGGGGSVPRDKIYSRLSRLRG